MKSSFNNSCENESLNDNIYIELSNKAVNFDYLAGFQGVVKVKSHSYKFLVILFFIIFGVILFSGVGSAVGNFPSLESSMQVYYHFNNNSAILILQEIFNKK